MIAASFRHECHWCSDDDVHVRGTPFGPACTRCGRFDGIRMMFRAPVDSPADDPAPTEGDDR